MSAPADPGATWGAALAWAVARLRVATSPTPKLDASILLAAALEVPRATVFGFPERPLAPEAAARFAGWIARRADGEPVAYLTGHKEFMGIDLLVDRRVLVPRPETELVVEAALTALSASEAPQEANGATEPVVDLLAADIGTGSGAIAIALAALAPRVGRVFAVDVSAEALAVARHNGDRAQVSGRVSWLLGDLLEPVPVAVDLIVANPPYVAPGEAAPNVARHEPSLALFSGADGLDHIRRLIAQAPAKLRPGGILTLEFGYDQRAAIAALLAAALPHATLTFGRDYAGWDRFVVARQPTT